MGISAWALHSRNGNKGEKLFLAKSVKAAAKLFDSAVLMKTGLPIGRSIRRRFYLGRAIDDSGG